MGEYDEYNDDEPVQQEPAVTAPAPFNPRQWSWNTQTLLWGALGAVGLGFGVWFLLAYTSARAVAIAEAVSHDNSN